MRFKTKIIFFQQKFIIDPNFHSVLQNKALFYEL